MGLLGGVCSDCLNHGLYVRHALFRCPQLLTPTAPITVIDLSDQPHLIGIGLQPLDLGCYDLLLSRG
jgi:hypothetical protein